MGFEFTDFDEDVRSIDRELFNAAAAGEAAEVEKFMAQGANVNVRERGSRLSVLHIVAARNAVPALRALIKSNALDYTALDAQGRSAANLAIEVANNRVVGRFLYDKMARQLDQRGLQPA